MTGQRIAAQSRVQVAQSLRDEGLGQALHEAGVEPGQRPADHGVTFVVDPGPVAGFGKPQGGTSPDRAEWAIELALELGGAGWVGVDQADDGSVCPDDAREPDGDLPPVLVVARLRDLAAAGDLPEKRIRVTDRGEHDGSGGVQRVAAPDVHRAWVPAAAGSAGRAGCARSSVSSD